MLILCRNCTIMASMIRRELTFPCFVNIYHRFAREIIKCYEDTSFVPREETIKKDYILRDYEDRKYYETTAQFSLLSVPILNNKTYPGGSYKTSFNNEAAELISAFYFPPGFTCVFYCEKHRLFHFPGHVSHTSLGEALTASRELPPHHLDRTLHLSNTVPLPLDYHQQSTIIIEGIPYQRHVIFQPAFPLADYDDLTMIMPRRLPFYVELAETKDSVLDDAIFWVESEGIVGIDHTFYQGKGLRSLELPHPELPLTELPLTELPRPDTCLTSPYTLMELAPSMY